MQRLVRPASNSATLTRLVGMRTPLRDVARSIWEICGQASETGRRSLVIGRPMRRKWCSGRGGAPVKGLNVALRKEASELPPSMGLDGCGPSPCLTMLQVDSLIIREKTGKTRKLALPHMPFLRQKP